MFVSSFTTYTVPNITQKTQSSNSVEKEKEYGSRFKDRLSFSQTNESQTELIQQNKLPLDYVSTPKSLQNQYKLQQQLKDGEQTKYKKMQNITNAKSEYAQNSSIFPLILKPKPYVVKQHPQASTQELKNPTLKSQMINTYIENENYYKITA